MDIKNKYAPSSNRNSVGHTTDKHTAWEAGRAAEHFQAMQLFLYFFPDSYISD